MVSLGIANSRMKDFYDIWYLCQNFRFEGVTLIRAIKATFDRRRTPLPAEPPLALTAEFSEDAAKQSQWKAFIRKGKLKTSEETLGEIIAVLQDFLMPPTQAATQGKELKFIWPPRGPWQPDKI
jgi:Nucleotidyl transferase AbiEii toxin, Type IV TA system